MSATSEVFVRDVAKHARTASRQMALASTEQKNRALEHLAKNLEEQKVPILAANGEDLKDAEKDGADAAFIDRLSLKGRLGKIIENIRKSIELPDPVGDIFGEKTLENGLKICKQRVPVGVIGVIYESRPNVTIEIASLTIKTGNCVILRGGKEARATNSLLTEIVQTSLKQAGLPPEAVLDIHRSDRSQVVDLLKLDEEIDMIIPRGGKSLHRFCSENSTIPIVTGGIGICHLYVDREVNIEKALSVIENAKIQRPTVCNALDTVLVHSDVAAQFVPLCIQKLGSRHVKFRLDSASMALLGSIDPTLKEQVAPAGEGDWDTEWLSLVLGIKIVDSINDAVDHIRKHSSGHSDGILTTNAKTGEEFVRIVDSAAVYVNASTRFTDGACFGLGAEVAISTQKFHARGPMGLEELTSYKWVVRGDNHVRKPRE